MFTYGGKVSEGSQVLPFVLESSAVIRMNGRGFTKNSAERKRIVACGKENGDKYLQEQEPRFRVQ